MYSNNSNVFFHDDAEVQLRIAQERDKDIKLMAESLQEVNEMMKDMAALVADQGVAIDNIVANIESAKKDTQVAVTELKSASKSQRRCAIL